MVSVRARSVYSILRKLSLVVAISASPFECRFEALMPQNGPLSVRTVMQKVVLNQAWGQVEISAQVLPVDSILASEWRNPFSKNSDTSQLESFGHELARETALTLATVASMENLLMQNETALRSAGFSSPAEFITAVSRASEKLPDSVKAEILASLSPHDLSARIIAGAAPFDGPESRELRELIETARAPLQDHFQNKRIAHTKAYFRLALALGALNAYDLAREVREQKVAIDEGTRARYEKLFQRLADSAKNYLQNEALYEGPKRNMAVTPHNDFLRTLSKISGLVDVLANAEEVTKELRKSPHVSNESKTLSRGLFVYLSRFVRGVVAAPLILFHATKVILAISRDRTYLPGKSVTSHGNLTVSNSVMEITRLLTPVLGFKVEFNGLEHLNSISPEAVSILTPTHRNALRDMIAVAALRFQNMALYANAGQIMNMAFGRGDTIRILGKTFDTLSFKRRVVGMLNRNPGVLVAGPTHNPDGEDVNFKPVQKGGALMAQDIRMFLNYPHGALPSDLGMDLPIVESWFGPKATLAEAWRMKQSPQIVIVTLPNNVDPLGLGLVPEFAKRVVRVQIHGVVPGQLIKTMVAFGGEKVLKNLFEANSNLGMVTNEVLHRGHIRTDRLPEMIGRHTSRSSDRAASGNLSLRVCESLFFPAH